MERHFSPKDQKVIVRYLNFLKYNPKEIYEIISAACGLHVADYQIVKEWLEKLQSGGKIDDDEEDCSPEREPINRELNETKGSSDHAAIARVSELISRDKRIPLEKIMELSLLSEEEAYEIVHDNLGLKKICERWVPRLWTPEQRSYRVEVSRQLLDRSDNEGDDFLNSIIIGDDSFIQYYTPTNAPKNLGSQKLKYIPEVDQTAVGFIIFYDCQGIILFKQVPEHTVVNSEYYAHFLRNELLPAIKEKRKDVDISKLCLIHGNSPTHNSLLTQKALDDIDLYPLPHPPSSPDMEPYDYFLFNYLRGQLKDKQFNSDNDIYNALKSILENLDSEQYGNSIRKLVERWESIIDSRGLYVY